MASGSLVFFGTNEISLPFLEALDERYRVRLVVTQPDSVGGRNRQPLIPPVKRYALERGLDVVQPLRLKSPEWFQRVRDLEPQAAVVVSYGRMIPEELYSLPRHGTLNVHFSLLPQYRGAAPVQRAIENGETRTGITVFAINERLDAGDIWSQTEMEIGPAETSVTLFRRMGKAGPAFLVETLEQIFAARIAPRPQDHSRATPARALDKKESGIDWTRTASRIHNQFRAFVPWPGLSFTADSRRLTVKKCRPAQQIHDRSPGAVHSLDRAALRVCCGEGTILEITEIQPEGKKPMTPFDYSLGNRFPDRLH